MTSARWFFTRGLDYASVVATSEQVAWTVDGVFDGRRFDASKSTVPGTWVRTEHLRFLAPGEQSTLNHLRAFSYAHLFGNYEEFIPLHLAEVAGRDWHGERARLRALLRFGEEEMKHQELFLRTEALLEEACGHAIGRYFDPEKVRVAELTNAILAFPPLPRSLMLLAFEWGSQRHYVDSVRDRGGECGDPLYVDVLKSHWIEESQHVKTGVLEIAELADAMSGEEISGAFDDVAGIAELIDATFTGQVEQEIATLEQGRAEPLTEAERGALREALYASMKSIWAEVAFTHPRFVALSRELSADGAAKLGIV